MHDQMPTGVAPKPRAGSVLESLRPDFFHRAADGGGTILLKVGADHNAGDHSAWAWLGLEELGNGMTWLGIFAFVASFGGWLYALRFLPLGIAFALTNGVHVFVPIGSWLFLGEHIGLLRGSGIGVIIAGILLLTQSVAKAEEKV